MGLAARLIAAIRRKPVTVLEVLDLARQDRLTGSVTLHFRDGVAKSVTHGAPYQTDLVEEEDAVAHRIPCRPPASSLTSG